MEKNEKKLSAATKKNIKTLVQDFLEYDEEQFKTALENESATEKYWASLDTLFFKNGFWMDELDSEDMENLDRKKILYEFYETLKPMWVQVKSSLTNYINEIVPERENAKVLWHNIENTTHPEIRKYKDLPPFDPAYQEKFYDITLQFKVSFDSGSVTFFKRKLSIVNGFLDFLHDLPPGLLSLCDYCHKVIVLTRSDKRYCRTSCASSRNQKEKWEKDREGMRKKERARNEQRKQQPK